MAPTGAGWPGPLCTFDAVLLLLPGLFVIWILTLGVVLKEAVVALIVAMMVGVLVIMDAVGVMHILPEEPSNI